MMHGRSRPTAQEAKLYKAIVKTANAFDTKWHRIRREAYRLKAMQRHKPYKGVLALLARCEYGRFKGSAAINEAKKDAEFFAKALRKVD